MKLKTAAMILSMGIAVSVLVTFFAFFSINLPEVMDVPIHFNVSDVMGFNVNTSALYFGTIPPSGTGTRHISIENMDGYAKMVGIRFFGQAAPWTYTENPSFTIGPHEKIKVPVNVHVPEDAPFGEYSGIARIYLTKAE